jgi:hypothetical protein
MNEVDQLNHKEYIRVLVRFFRGETVCICMRDNPRCNKRCTSDIVERDKFRGWEKAFNQNKFGK